jgi:hypothetical protein
MKKVLPGAKERRLNHEEARHADNWIVRVQSGEMDWERELDSLSNREIMYLYFTFRYSLENLKGRFLMPMERYGFLGMVAKDVDKAMSETSGPDLQRFRANVKKVFLASISHDASLDLRGLIFDIKWKYRL